MKWSDSVLLRAKIFGAAVRAERQDRGWTQADLGHRAGLGIVSLAKIEAGFAGTAYGTVLELCSILNLSPDPDRIASSSAQVRALTALAGKRARVRRRRIDPALDV